MHTSSWWRWAQQLCTAHCELDSMNTSYSSSATSHSGPNNSGYVSLFITLSKIQTFKSLFYFIHKPAVCCWANIQWLIHLQRSFEMQVHVCVFVLHICYPVNMWHQGYTPYIHTSTEACTPLHTIITSNTSAHESCPCQGAVQSKFNENDPSHNHWCTHTKRSDNLTP